MDELISILVFVIIKSGLTHWFATFKFLNAFMLNDLNDLSDKGADSFLVTTLEAAIFYIKSFDENKRHVDDGALPPMAEQRNKFASKSEFIENLHCHIRKCDWSGTCVEGRFKHVVDFQVLGTNKKFCDF